MIVMASARAESVQSITPPVSYTKVMNDEVGKNTNMIILLFKAVDVWTGTSIMFIFIALVSAMFKTDSSGAKWFESFEIKDLISMKYDQHRFLNILNIY